MKTLLTFTAALACFATAEDVSVLIETTGSQFSDSAPITINEGDTAKLEFASVPNVQSWSFSMFCTIGGKQTSIPCFQPGTTMQTTNPIKLAGPATIFFRAGTPSAKHLATLSITRAGIASPPAAIPQEADTTWQVILESSSDLINWTAANPGEYSGTEPKRFFRTRMVKKS